MARALTLLTVDRACKVRPAIRAIGGARAAVLTAEGSFTAFPGQKLPAEVEREVERYAARLPVGWQQYLDAVARALRGEQGEAGIRPLAPGDAGYGPEAMQVVAPPPPLMYVAPRPAHIAAAGAEPTPIATRRVRVFRAEDGRRYRARLVPMERAGALGVDWRLNAIAFETTEGEWIGSVPIYHNVALERLSRRDLEEMLGQAIGRA